MKYPKNDLVLFSQDKEGILSKKCDKVTVFDNHLQEFTNYMFEMMEKYRGIGISANQLGISKQIFVIKMGFYKEVFINSTFEGIRSKKNLILSTEGCLSFGEKFKSIQRFDEIKVLYQDVRGKEVNSIFSDIMSVCFQHEWEHGQGIHFENRKILDI